MKSKVIVILSAFIFAVAFGVVGWFGVASLAAQLQGWVKAQAWQQVPATVVEAELIKTQDEGTTYRATARYRYQVNGKTYESTRVGFGEGSDNLGTWQEDKYNHLALAKRSEEPINVWVDADNPMQAVIDRAIRWEAIALTIPFATLFPLVSFGALFVIFVMLRTPDDKFNAKPVLAKNKPEIKPNPSRAAVFWVFGVFWNLIAFPLAFGLIPRAYGQSWTWIFIMLFPVVGVGLLIAAAGGTLKSLRSGRVFISLGPAQPHLGATINVIIRFAPRMGSMPPSGSYVVTLICEEVDTRPEDAVHKTVWQQQRDVNRPTDMNAGQDGRIDSPLAKVTFSPPANVPASQVPTSIYHRWRVLIGFPGGSDERSFDVVIGPANKGF